MPKVKGDGKDDAAPAPATISPTVVLPQTVDGLVTAAAGSVLERQGESGPAP
jgi:hypothetical protein